MPNVFKRLEINKRENMNEVTFDVYTFPSGVENVDNVIVKIYVTKNQQDSEYRPIIIINEDRNDELTIAPDDPIPSGIPDYNCAFTLKIPREDNEDGEEGHTFYAGHTIKARIIECSLHGQADYVTIEYEHEGELITEYLKWGDHYLCMTMHYKKAFADGVNLPEEGKAFYMDQSDVDKVMLEHNLFPPIPAAEGKLRVLLPQAMLYRVDTRYEIGKYVLYDPEEDDVGIIDLHFYHFYRRQQNGPAGIPPTNTDYWHRCPDLDPGITFYEPDGSNYLLVVPKNS